MAKVKEARAQKKKLELAAMLAGLPKVKCDAFIPSLCWKIGTPKPSYADWTKK